jgi:hypothetical protein
MIAVLHAVMAITAVREKSPTYDEPAHLTAGYSYWLTNDFRLNPENGNLPQRWAALPLLISRPNFIALDDQSWTAASKKLTAHQLFYERGNDSDFMLRQGRMMIAVFSAALCLLIFRCSREFFGAIGGLISELVAAFDPTMLAHGALVTSDMAVTLFFLAAVWSIWRMFEKLTPGRFAIAVLATSGLFMAKFSAPLILPIMSILGGLKILSPEPVGIQVGRFQKIISNKWRKSAALVVSIVLLGSAVLLAVWASFGFRFDSLTNAGSARAIWNQRWDYHLEQGGPVRNVIAFARMHRLLPEAYLYGLAFVHEHTADRPAFLDNQWSLVGFRSFFPRAFLYKTPLPMLCLLGLASVAAFSRWSNSRRFSPWPMRQIIIQDLLRLAPFWALLFVYGVCAVMNNLNIGHRHLLPIYAPLFVLCGACSYFPNKKPRAIATCGVALLLLWQSAESLVSRPNYLAYFNQLAGGSSRGYEHLVDSSLDWGQDLPALKSWLDQHHETIAGQPIYLAYFGSAEPRWYGIEAISLPRDPSAAVGSAGLGPGIYCISATTLQRVYTPEMGPWARPYEEAYQKALAKIARYRQIAPDPATRARFIESEGADRWSKEVEAFERLRFGRLCAYLKKRKTFEQVGCSIFVFTVSRDDLDLALYGPPAELESEISVIGK